MAPDSDTRIRAALALPGLCTSVSSCCPLPPKAHAVATAFWHCGGDVVPACLSRSLAPRYTDRLKGKMRVILLTNDAASRRKALEEGVEAMGESRAPHMLAAPGLVLAGCDP